MRDYEPFDGAKGDPWSTEPVGEPPRTKREPEADGHYDESHVLARVPDLADDTAAESHRHYGHSSSGHRRRRSPSQRPGVPAPVWVVLGMGLLGLFITPFFLWTDKSSQETALDAPAVWQQEPLAPNADLAPAWSTDTNTQWQQPAVGQLDNATAANIDAEPAAIGGWNTTSPTEDWVGAPPIAPYAHNAADPATQRTAPQDGTQFGTGATANIPMSPPVAAQPSATGWDTNIPPAVPSTPAQTSYPGAGLATQPGYPNRSGIETPSWADNTATPASRTMNSYDTTQPSLPANSWNQNNPAPPLTTPQPETVMPGYGAYPAAQPNPYVRSQPNGATTGYRDGYTAAPNVGAPTPQAYPNSAPNYPVANQQPLADPYPVTAYPQTAMNPNTATPPVSAPTGGAPAYYPRPAAPPTSYPPATGSPYVPQTTPAAPAGRPYYGTDASTNASQQSVARLNGTIQEPAARAAYDDRARPSFY